MKRGGLAPKRKGDAFEVEVAQYYRGQGSVCERIRQGQGEIIDLISIAAVNGRLVSVHFIQCRLRGKMSKAEKDLLITIADRAGAIPVLAWKAVDGKLKLELLKEQLIVTI